MTSAARKEREAYVSKTYLNIPVEDRKKTLLSNRVQDLFSFIPPEVKAAMIDLFINGVSHNSESGKVYLQYTEKNSLITPSVLNESKAPFPFELIYRKIKAGSSFDAAYVRTTGALGILLRKKVIADDLPGIIRREIKNQKLNPDEKFYITDVGSGPADAVIEALSQSHNRDLLRKVIVNCVDPNADAVKLGRAAALKAGLENIVIFHEATMYQYVCSPKFKASHLMLIIGILCPTKSDDCISTLQMLKKCSHPNGLVMFSNVMVEMLKQDPLLDFYMRVLKWCMDYKTPEEILRITNQSGLIVESFFRDALKCNQMTLARVSV